MDHVSTAKRIMEFSGGNGNISSVTHCATRLRLFIVAKGKVELDKIKKLQGVLGTVFVGDELQIVLGKELIPVYNEAVKLYTSGQAGDGSGGEAGDGSGEQTGKESKEQAGGQSGAQTGGQSDTLAGEWAGGKTARTAETRKTGAKKAKELGGRLIGFISASVTPMIPGLVAGGMLKTFLLLFTLAWKPFAETQTYTLLGMLADVPFFFMPVFVAYGAARKLGSTPVFAMIAAGGLVYPDLAALLAGKEAVYILGLPVMAVRYSSTLLPALLIAACAYYCERILVKIIPGLIRPVLLGVGTIAITYTLGITVLGPLGDVIGSYVVHIFLWTSENLGPVAVGILSGCMPFLVMTGMHHAVTPFMVQAISDPGYDVLFRPAYILHNMAEGGACLGVALRAKEKAFKAECFSLAFGCIVAGVTEPAVYGVNLPLKKPMIGVVAGAASGGVVAGLLGATAYVYGYSTILAIPIFQQTILAIIAAIAVAICVSTAVTFVLGFDAKDINR